MLIRCSVTVRQNAVADHQGNPDFHSHDKGLLNTEGLDNFTEKAILQRSSDLCGLGLSKATTPLDQLRSVLLVFQLKMNDQIPVLATLRWL